MARILSLHAESEILGLLQIIFNRAGHESMSTTDSKTALDTLRTQNIDLLIQNLMRPDINGCEFYDIIRNDSRLRDIPVLIISAVNPLTYPEICDHIIHDLYPHHYLLMPFRPQVLLATINRILREETPAATTR